MNQQMIDYLDSLCDSFICKLTGGWSLHGTRKGRPYLVTAQGRVNRFKTKLRPRLWLPIIDSFIITADPQLVRRHHLKAAKAALEDLSITLRVK